jgi:polyhydroxyalkanoate synthesis regulator phasin
MDATKTMRGGLGVTVSNAQGPAPWGGGASAAKQEGSTMAGAINEQGTALAGTVLEDGQRVAQEAKQQIGHLTEQAQQQLQEMMHRAQQELADRASDQAKKAASGLRSFASELSALGEGRTEDAPRLVGNVRDVSARTSYYADRLEPGGAQGVAQDLAQFARRRPAVFLLGAVAAGFFTGRLLRGVQRANLESGESVSGLGPDAHSDVAGPGVGQVMSPQPAGLPRSFGTDHDDIAPPDTGPGVV